MLVVVRRSSPSPFLNALLLYAIRSMSRGCQQSRRIRTDPENRNGPFLSADEFVWPLGNEKDVVCFVKLAGEHEK